MTGPPAGIPTWGKRVSLCRSEEAVQSDEQGVVVHLESVQGILSPVP